MTRYLPELICSLVIAFAVAIITVSVLEVLL